MPIIHKTNGRCADSHPKFSFPGQAFPVWSFTLHCPIPTVAEAATTPSATLGLPSLFLGLEHSPMWNWGWGTNCHISPSSSLGETFHLCCVLVNVTVLLKLVLAIHHPLQPSAQIEKSTQSLPAVGSDSKESACNVGDLGLIPGLGRSPGGRHGNPLQYSCLANSSGQRSLAGYSLRGHKESDMTEQLHTHPNTHRGLHAVHHPELTIQSDPTALLQILILLYFFFSVS